jgi:hypothetical protein
MAPMLAVSWWAMPILVGYAVEVRGVGTGEIDVAIEPCDNAPIA